MREGAETADGRKTTRHPPSLLVGVGASAGGLDALERLVAQIPAESPLTVVVVQHLDPAHPSSLAEILARRSALPVQDLVEDVPIRPGVVFVLTPGLHVEADDGHLRLGPRPESGPALPVDTLFRSMATLAEGRIVGVVLSGTGTDGTLGLGEIKAAGGITMAQDPATAAYDGMPRSAIDAGFVDIVGSPEALANDLERIAGEAQPGAGPVGAVAEAHAVDVDAYRRIIGTLSGDSGIDFGQYKPSTVERRLSRRMTVCRTPTIREYADLLQRDPDERDALRDELLIIVTSFFREPAVFEALADEVFPAIVDRLRPTDTIRMWVAGCATGQEAYSLLIALNEFLADHGASRRVQMFATDASEQAIATARAGIYSEADLTDVDRRRRERYFEPVAGGWRVSRELRDQCVFARHDLTRDPPFSRQDLISCRNLLIYFTAALQHRVLSVLHYALSPEGILVLGSAEGVSANSAAFTTVDAKNSIFVRSAAEIPVTFQPGATPPTVRLETAALVRPVAVEATLRERMTEELLDVSGAAGVLVDGNMDIVQFRGSTGAYLEPPSGNATLNLFAMAREGLAVDLHDAMAEARENGVSSVRREARVVTGEGYRLVDIEVRPIDLGGTGTYFVVAFGPAAPDTVSTAGEPTAASRADLRELAYLRRELASTRDVMKTLVDEKDAANEELRAVLEASQSANEELQSMNEELETAKEELQSTNEELVTVNEELHDKNTELSQLGDDLNNLLRTIQVPAVLVDAQLRIRRFTPHAESILSLLPGDVGRPFTDLALNVDVPDAAGLIETVVETGHPVDREVETSEGQWLRMTVRPYELAGGQRDGAVIAFEDIDALKRGLLATDSENEALGELVRARTADLEHALADVERSSALKDRFLADVSHELRTPLNSIVGFSGLLAQGLAGELTPEQERQVAFISESSHQLLRLVNGLLDLASIEAGRVPVNRKPFIVADEVEAVRNAFQARADSAGIALIIDGPQDRAAEMDCDEAKVHQMLTNLFDNALKFTEHGHVALRTNVEPETVTFVVEDTGVGITADQVPAITDAFQQFQNIASSAKPMGVGLGLSITKRFAEMLGGTLECESEAGKGSRFTVRLPRSCGGHGAGTGGVI